MVMENKVRIVVILTKLLEENEQGESDLSNLDLIGNFKFVFITFF